MELNSFNIVKAVKNDKYQISFAKGSSGQKEYLEKMLLLFGVKKENNFRRDTLLLSQGIKKFFIGLPQIIRLCSKSNNYLSLDERFLSYKTLFTTFDLNPYEVVFDQSLPILPALIVGKSDVSGNFAQSVVFAGNAFENRIIALRATKAIVQPLRQKGAERGIV